MREKKSLQNNVFLRRNPVFLEKNRHNLTFFCCLSSHGKELEFSTKTAQSNKKKIIKLCGT